MLVYELEVIIATKKMLHIFIFCIKLCNETQKGKIKSIILSYNRLQSKHRIVLIHYRLNSLHVL